MQTKRMREYVFAWIFLLAASEAFAVDNTATNSGNWEDGGTWSLGVAPAPSHDVIIPSTNITVTINGLTTRFIHSLTIAGTLTHAANEDIEAHKIMLDIAGDLTVVSNGVIDVTAKGFSTRQGPGATDRVDYYDQINWIGTGAGAVFIVR